ncbi:MAG: FHA domain-containing protein [Myxococcales bacterium]|nr:FHA domain-containing protein [Myxococcales bacterium]
MSENATRMARLRVRDEEGAMHTVSLAPLWDADESIGIGREEDNAVYLPQRTVSRHHARIIREGEHLFVEDLSSFNGVSVNGAIVDGRRQLGPSDRIEIGGYLLWFENDQGTAPFEAPTMRIEKHDIPDLDFD